MASLVNYRPRPSPLNLTTRERELLGLLMEGLSQQEAARRLHITDNTVKTHLRGLYRKMRVRSRTQAVLQGVRMGLAEG